jgi:hypothetical protein
LAAGGAAATSAPASAGAAPSSAWSAASRRSNSTCLVPVWSRLRVAHSSRSSCMALARQPGSSVRADAQRPEARCGGCNA